MRTPPEGMTRRDFFKAAAVGAGAMALAPLLPREAHAALPSTVLDPDKGIPSANVALNTALGNMTWKASTSAVGTYLGSDGARVFTLKSKATGSTASWEYADPIEFTFSGNEIGGRAIDVALRVRKVRVTKNHHPDKPTMPKTFTLARVTKGYFYFNNSIDTARRQWFVDYEVEATWADTGEVAELPFFQLVSDLDSQSAHKYFTEAWEPTGGFDRVYTYDGCYLVRSGDRFAAPGPDRQTSGDDSIVKSGVVGSAPRGSFSGRLEMGDSATWIAVYCDFAALDGPKKSAAVTG